MEISPFTRTCRPNKSIVLSNEFTVIGGGIAGVCAAITAARQGTKTVLIQDRPVLGGNASSEVRLWILGATSHMGNNNRWSREGGVIDEILVENMYRNKEGNAVVFDVVLLEKVLEEKNITLLLNTSVYNVTKSNARIIESVNAFNSQNSTEYIIKSPLFCDASGDGIVAFKAGASFRMGAESKDEFGELFAPDKSFGELLGHSMYFYSKNTDKPIKFVPPEFALKDIKQIPRYRAIGKDDNGCRFWWFEYGGRMDTIHDTEKIKYELWKVIYGVWDYIKNSGEFEDVDNMTLEWVGSIPGKRESRRFEGLYMMKQQDVIQQQDFSDAIAHGGWAIDLHPADGIYSNLSGCTQWHTKGIYQIPYRSIVSKDINNLFLGGRIMSATHVAFGSTRVMATTGLCAQAIGMAASMCIEKSILPHDILKNNVISALQDNLNRVGQSIPNIPIQKKNNLISKSKISATSSLTLDQIPFDGVWLKLDISAAQLLPLKANQKYNFKVTVDAKENTSLELQLRTSEKPKNYTPETILVKKLFQLKKGVQNIEFNFEESLTKDQYIFLTFLANKFVKLKSSNKRYTGVLSVFNGINRAVSNFGKQNAPATIGIDSFEFWTPQRRPEGKNIAMDITPPLKAFDVYNIGNGYVRPWISTNAWVANPTDNNPNLQIIWEEEQQISEIKIFFDTDYDHPMESTLMGHHEDVVPFCIRDYKIKGLDGVLLCEKQNNYQTINTWYFKPKIKVLGLIIEVKHPSMDVPASIFEIVIK